MAFLRLAILFVMIAGPALSESTTFTMVSGDPGMINHWPAADASFFVESAPNSYGSYCYNAFDFGTGQTDPGIPSPYDAITFIEGSVDIDLDAVSGRVSQEPWITGLTVTQGTLPHPFHAPYSAAFTAINDWIQWGDHNFIINVDFEANLGGSPDTALNMEMEGEIWMIAAADFGTPSGHPYLDEVIIPRAQAQQASRFVFMWAMGTIPAAEGESWGPMPMLATVVGFTDAVAAGETSWSDLRRLY